MNTQKDVKQETQFNKLHEISCISDKYGQVHFFSFCLYPGSDYAPTKQLTVNEMQTVNVEIEKVKPIETNLINEQITKNEQNKN